MAQTEFGGPAEGSLGYPVDRKYDFLARSVEHETEHSRYDAVLFCAHDAAFPRALQAYREELIRLSAGSLQLAACDRLIEDVRLWQARHPQLVRVPSIEDPHLLRDPKPEAPRPKPAGPPPADAVSIRL